MQADKFYLLAVASVLSYSPQQPVCKIYSAEMARLVRASVRRKSDCRRYAYPVAYTVRLRNASIRSVRIYAWQSDRLYLPENSVILR